jgi:hypothetical protein
MTKETETMKRFLIATVCMLALSSAAGAAVTCDADGNCMASSPHAVPPPSVTYIAPSNRAVPASDCDQVVHPVGLDKFRDNNLSVHPSPYNPSARTEIDELVPGDQVCVLPGNVGPWVHVQYTRGGRTRTGWAHSSYLAE